METLERTTAVVTDRPAFSGHMSPDPVIDVDKLNVTYGDFHAVKDLSFQIERGELYALLGIYTPHGCRDDTPFDCPERSGNGGLDAPGA